ncbi:Gag-pol Polyprotein [Phytophthora megakarya]|uniref:Gag-pol Polyprotein n=1 Tax=Phytophthora megakarya TaxID=4795 RepID=A0A225VVV9_9STRA|nr:Gag-pol Polyprotein [Phytophthora megakarya]
MKRMQLDVKTAFLNSDLDEEIYLERAEGYQSADGHVWRLLKALYRLKQASRLCVDDDDLMIVLVYVNDILVFAMHDEDLLSFKAALEAGSPSGNEVAISQQKYTKSILERFNMPKAMPARTPMEERFRDQLRKRTATTAVRILAQEIETPTNSLKQGVEHVFRYLGSTQEFGMLYTSNGYAIFYNGCLIEWESKKQSMVTLSSTEAEYIAMGSGVQECIGINLVLKDLDMEECIGINLVLKDLGMEVDQITVFEDNQGGQHLAESKAVTQRSRHIDTKYHWLRQKVKEGDVHISYYRTSEMIADHFTKGLGVIKFKHFRDELGVRRVGVLDQSGASNPSG